MAHPRSGASCRPPAVTTRLEDPASTRQPYCTSPNAVRKACGEPEEVGRKRHLYGCAKCWYTRRKVCPPRCEGVLSSNDSSASSLRMTPAAAAVRDLACPAKSATGSASLDTTRLTNVCSPCTHFVFALIVRKGLIAHMSGSLHQSGQKPSAR